MFKLKEKTDENVVLVKEKLLGMKGKIDQLQDIVVAKNLRAGPNGFDVVMIAKYNSMKDFEEYIAHPVHVERGTYVLSLCEETASVCFEE
jgi:hypothetical protein